jgi:CheY-like chemotaxis protein
VEFPVAEAARVPANSELVAAAGDRKFEAKTDRSVVLYVEDNPQNLRLMQRIFAVRTDLELRDAHTAELGIEMARDEPPALILMDINLPGMDGFAALAVLKADPRTAHIPIIAVSAKAMKGDDIKGMKAGLAAYISKPIDISVLFRTVDQYLAKVGDRA